MYPAAHRFALADDAKPGVDLGQLIGVEILHGGEFAASEGPGLCVQSLDIPCALHGQGDGSWALRAFREMDEALLELRFNFNQVGLVLLKTKGDPAQVEDAFAKLRRGVAELGAPHEPVA